MFYESGIGNLITNFTFNYYNTYRNSLYLLFHINYLLFKYILRLL